MELRQLFSEFPSDNSDFLRGTFQMDQLLWTLEHLHLEILSLIDLFSLARVTSQIVVRVIPEIEHQERIVILLASHPAPYFLQDLDRTFPTTRHDEQIHSGDIHALLKDAGRDERLDAALLQRLHCPIDLAIQRVPVHKPTVGQHAMQDPTLLDVVHQD